MHKQLTRLLGKQSRPSLTSKGPRFTSPLRHDLIKVRNPWGKGRWVWVFSESDQTSPSGSVEKGGGGCYLKGTT